MFAEVKRHLHAWSGLKQNMTVVWGSQGFCLILNGLITDLNVSDGYLELKLPFTGNMNMCNYYLKELFPPEVALKNDSKLHYKCMHIQASCRAHTHTQPLDS